MGVLFPMGVHGLVWVSVLFLLVCEMQTALLGSHSWPQKLQVIDFL